MSADDEQAIERIRYKASMHFVHELEAYMKYAGEHFFLVADIQLKDVCISASEIRDCYLGTMITPIRRRLEKTASILSGRVRTEDGERLTAAEAKSQNLNQEHVQISKCAQHVQGIFLI